MRGFGNRTRLTLFVVFLAGCSDATPFVPTSKPDTPRPAGENLLLTELVDEFDGWNRLRWVPESHAMGKGRIEAENVRLGDGTLELRLPAERFDGSEIISYTRPRHRPVEARLRVPDAPGSISAFFLYQGIRGGNDEIDIEIFNDDSRAIWFTVWVAGEQVYHARRTLAFDPRADFHDYRIEWSQDLVRFVVDGETLAAFTDQVPAGPLYLMSNAWWPTWLEADAPKDESALEIDRIVY